MKPLPSLLLLATVGCATAFAGDAPPTRKPLPYAQCIQTDRINEWHIVDKRTAVVRTGPYRYAVHLKADCPRLGIGVPGFLLHASESGKVAGEGRICGGLGETVSARDQPPCAISSVELIDKASFERMRKHAARHGSGAELPPSR
ncbi:DUF6491 family protein [Frateuria terrea]|uniref:Uncharacterized protein n=1 Tax=Frateuria terrea TaxID=529704 RepID=A0A1H6W209_9GAMM|nr:DUF6491 family protein [Frateuria terrea]SEJ10923.1 hypothetical protein SAMN04487997_2544 [Frateuria terrea]SFP67629.1 hypothetical protein SAMN02927913_3109 [Frateuria terrea]